MAVIAPALEIVLVYSLPVQAIEKYAAEIRRNTTESINETISLEINLPDKPRRLPLQALRLAIRPDSTAILPLSDQPDLPHPNPDTNACSIG